MAKTVNGSLVYVGTYTGTGSKGIYGVRPTSGVSKTLTPAAAVNLTFLTLNARGLPCTASARRPPRARPSRASAFAVDPETGALSPQPSTLQRHEPVH